MNARCADRNPVERAIEVAVYAPIGLLALASEQLPAIVELGRQRVQQRLAVARLVGELTLRLGRAQVARRLAAEPGTVADITVDHVVHEPAPAEVVAPEFDADALPIDDYESLAASQVVARLEALDSHELDLVEEFERGTRNRRTVLGRIAQLRVPS